MKKECPYCHQVFEIENGKVFSNHVRWCPENHTNGDKGKLAQSKAEKLPRIKVKKICPKCGKEFEVERAIKNGKEHILQDEPKYCSRSCANGHIVSKETKKKISEGHIKRSDKICLQCGKVFNTRGKTCSRSCARKYRYRNIDKESLHYYRIQCAFKFALSDYPEEFDFQLIEEYGWYKAKNHGNNLNGISRDHMVSIKYGFDHHIPPEIISHPANCQLLRHNENSSKHDKCAITIEELYEKIWLWNEKYGVKVA